MEPKGWVADHSTLLQCHKTSTTVCQPYRDTTHGKHMGRHTSMPLGLGITPKVHKYMILQEEVQLEPKQCRKNMISIKYKKIFIENDITIKFANMSKDVWTKWSLENLLYTTVIILLYLGGVAPITSPLSPKHHSLHEGKYKTMPDEGTVVTPPWHCTHTYGGGGHLKPGCIILYLRYLYLYIYLYMTF